MSIKYSIKSFKPVIPQCGLGTLSGSLGGQILLLSGHHTPPLSSFRRQVGFS